MTACALAAATCLGAAVALTGSGTVQVRHRVVRLAAEPARNAVPRQWLGVLVAAVTLLATAAALGTGPALLGAGPLLGVLGLRASGRRRRPAALQKEVTGQLPRIADLVAACLEAGATPVAALEAATTAVPGPVAEQLRPVVAALRAGRPATTVRRPAVPPTAVRRAARRPDRDDPVQVLVRAIVRAFESGAPLVEALAAMADDQRRQRRWAAEARARRAGVLAVGPLMLCFLPAFVLLGIVPVVVGVARAVLVDLT